MPATNLSHDQKPAHHIEKGTNDEGTQMLDVLFIDQLTVAVALGADGHEADKVSSRA